MNKKTALEQLEYWIEEYYRINGTPTLSDIKGQINLLKDYEQEQLRIVNVSKRFSSAEKMAEWLHNNYEEIALNNGWKTQEDCQVPFCDLPKENKQTMIEVCERFLNVC